MSPYRTLGLRAAHAVFAAAVLAASVAALAPEALGAGTYHVDGSSAACTDSGPGTVAAPYCTISAAVQARGGPSTTLLVHPAIYRESVTLTASGATGAPFTLQAVGPGAVIDGSDDFASPTKWIFLGGGLFLGPGVTWSPLQVFADGARLSASAAPTPGGVAPGSYLYVQDQGLYVNLGGANPGSHGLAVGRRLNGLRLSGRSNIVLDGFTVRRTEDNAITLLSGSNSVSVTRNTVQQAYRQGINVSASSGAWIASNVVSDNCGHGIYLLQGVTGSTITGNECFANARPLVRASNGIQLFGSSGNVIQANRLHDNQDSGLQINSGSNNTICLQNLSWRNGDHGYSHQSSTGTLHVGDVAWGNASNGFFFSTGSTGSRVYDAIAAENGLTSHLYALSVDSTSSTGFASNFNVFWSSAAQPVARFGSTSYATLAAFTASTAQDAASAQLDPRFLDPAGGDFRLSAGSPAIDSAASDVPSWPAADALGQPRQDDPTVPNSGAGPVPFADRGALEFQPPNLPPDGTIDAPPSDITVTEGDSVSFAGTGWDPNGDALVYSWTFGGGAPDSGVRNPGPVAFPTPGTYLVTLTVTDDGGLADPTPATRLVTVQGNHPPVGSIDAPATDVTIAVGDSVAFAGSGSDRDGDSLTYHWTFGGGAPDSNVEDPGPVVFATPGTFLVTLTVVDARGLADPRPPTRLVTVQSNQPPSGHIDRPTGPITVQACQPVVFQASATDPDGDLALTYHWTFGADIPDQDVEDPGAVVFPIPGTYTVTMTVTDSLGLSDPTPETVLVTILGQIVVDEVHFTFTSPTSVSFDWRGAPTVLTYGTTSAYGDSATAAPAVPAPFSSCGPFREVQIQGLQEDTLYHYSIGGGLDATFRTPLPRGASGFTVYAEGDVGDSGSYPNMPLVQDLIAADLPSFVLMLGDLTYANDHGLDAVDQHYNDVMAWSRSVAYMPAWGNHEWDTTGHCSLATSTECNLDSDCPSPQTCLTIGDDLRNYKGRFDLPNPRSSSNGPSLGCCEEDWYWFDYGNVRFIAYPEPYDGVSTWQEWAPEAAALMDAAQADPAIRFIVTIGHRPAYSSGHHPGDNGLRAILDALGDTHGKYVLNLSGHSHDLERSFPQHGVVHITNGGGGASLEQDGACLYLTCVQPVWSAFRAMHLGPVKLRFTDATIEGWHICGPPGGGTNDVTCTPGSVIDHFTIPPLPPEGHIDEPLGTMTIPMGGSVTFRGSGSDPNLYDPLTYAWDFGGVAPGSTAADPGAVVFPAPGVYTIRLTVTNQAGISDPTPEARTVIVRPPFGGPPTSISHQDE